MANASLKEVLKVVFSDVILTVDPNTFKDPNQVKYLLTGCGNRVTGTLHYEVRGSFEEIEDLFVKMSSIDRYAAPNLRDSPLRHLQRLRSPSPVKPVAIVGAVWDFIQQRCSKELKRIQGEDVLIHKLCDKMVVTFESHRKDSVRVHFARERFVTFYQRLATDLKVQTYSLDPQYYKSLQRQFPELLIEGGPSKDNITVTGRYMHIVMLEDFLRHGSSSPVTSQRPLTPQRVSPRASGTTRNKQSDDEEEESCPICLDTIKEDRKKTLACKHSFCRGCLEKAFKTKPVCPTCGAVYGELKGTQPKGGTMAVTQERSSLSGYDKYGTIVIQYHIPSGIQKEEHPNPGQTYQGASRTAYLPDSSEGRNVLALLKRAFDQRLTFTIGRSSTTGMENMVTWNDIHHKTSRSGGTSCYGYPDPDYLRRLQDELKVKGIY